LVETRLYLWRGFVAEIPGWSPIVATPAVSYTQRVSAVECSDRATITVIILVCIVPITVISMLLAMRL